MSRDIPAWLAKALSVLIVVGSIGNLVQAADRFSHTPFILQPGTPLEDTGFAPATPLPDPDLIIVREKAYGVEGVDLTAYGIGSGPVDYVQSIYLRFFVDNDPSTVDSYTGCIVFPDEIEILGTITGESDLGGSIDDGVATQTDLTFGVSATPDDYSEYARGLDYGGGIATSEFVCITSSNSLVFGLNINGGVDDFRIIIDYGSSFPESLAFDVAAYDIGSLGGAVPSTGIRIGDASDPTVLGSGDFGESGSLVGIPLTSSMPPDTSESIPFDPLNNLFILRDTSDDTFVDAYDASLRLPAPDRYRLNADTLGNPIGITDGPDSLLYAIGMETGFSIIDPFIDVVTMKLLVDLSGSNVDVTGLSDVRDLFILRDTSEDTYVDRLNIDTHTFDEAFTISESSIGYPVGITDADDGNLYVLGDGGGFASVDPDSGIVTTSRLPATDGNYVSLTGREGSQKLYLLRDTSGDTYIDEYDINSQSITFGIASTSLIGYPASITDGPDGLIYLIGEGSSGAASYVVIDPDLAAITESNSCMDFIGTNVSITNIGTNIARSGVTSMPIARHKEFIHWCKPNPFRSGTAVHYIINRPVSVEVSIYDVKGHLIRVLWEGERAVGIHGEVWDGTFEDGSAVPSGVYFYRIDARPVHAVGRLVLVR